MPFFFSSLDSVLALFDADGADQDRLTLGVALGDLLNDGVVLAVDGLVDAVGQVLAGAGLLVGMLTMFSRKFR